MRINIKVDCSNIITNDMVTSVPLFILTRKKKGIFIKQKQKHSR